MQIKITIIKYFAIFRFPLVVKLRKCIRVIATVDALVPGRCGVTLMVSSSPISFFAMKGMFEFNLKKVELIKSQRIYVFTTKV